MSTRSLPSRNDHPTLSPAPLAVGWLVVRLLFSLTTPRRAREKEKKEPAHAFAHTARWHTNSRGHPTGATIPPREAAESGPWPLRVREATPPLGGHHHVGCRPEQPKGKKKKGGISNPTEHAGQRGKGYPT